MFTPFLRYSSKTGPNFNTFNCIYGHHGKSQGSIQLIKYRIA